MKKNDFDSVAVVLEDYKKIAEVRDWKKELELVTKAANDYIETMKSFIEATQYNRKASRIIESLASEVEDQRIQIFEMEAIISELNLLVETLMERLGSIENEEEGESE